MNELIGRKSTPVFQVRLKEDRETGLNKGFGFVTFTTKEEAEKAIETLSEKELKVCLFTLV